MIKKFVYAWEENKDKLVEYLKTHKQEEYDNYKKLVKILFDIVINPKLDSNCHTIFNTDDIIEIDHGNYCGNLIFILHKDIFQPSVYNNDYVYTNVFYGSCSVCDTLQSIQGYDYEKYPTEEQVKDYMTLFLHLLQRCHYMIDTDIILNKGDIK